MIEEGSAPRRAAYATLRAIMNSPSAPLGAEIRIFRDGKMLHTGDYVQHILSRDVVKICAKVGVIGVKVKICRSKSDDVKIPDFIQVHKADDLLDSEHAKPVYE